MPALLALIAVTAVWGYTFVPMKDAVAIYPLFAFLAVRFLIASAVLRVAAVAIYPLFAFLAVRFLIASVVLAVPAAGRMRSLGRRGWVAGVSLGLLLALGYALQTAGLARTTVSSAGFITGLYVVFTPLLGLLLFRTHVGRAVWLGVTLAVAGLALLSGDVGRAVWLGVALAVAGLALLSGVGSGNPRGDPLVLAGAAAYSLQIALMERYAPRYDPVAFTQAEMLAAFAGFAVVAVALGQVEVPRGWTVWGALLVTGIFASALGFLVQTWAQRRISASRTAIAFAMEPVFAGIFGFWLAGDRLGVAGWGGCALIMAGILVAEPEAGRTLRRLVNRSGSEATL